MTEERAKEIIGDPLGSAYELDYLDMKNAAAGKVILDGEFTAEQLEAIGWWIFQSHKPTNEKP